MERDELGPNHYWRFPGESERDRLKRRIAFASKDIGGGDPTGFWQKELNRFKAEMVIADQPDGHRVIGRSLEMYFHLVVKSGHFFLEIQPERALASSYAVGEIEKNFGRWGIKLGDKKIEGVTPQQVAQLFWIAYVAEKGLRQASINDKNRNYDLDEWTPPGDSPSLN